MAKEEDNVNADFRMVRGFPFPYEKHFTVKNIEDAMDYVPKDGDVILAAYPKTGSTWMQYILLQIISKGTSFPKFDDALHEVVPYLEMVGTTVVEAMSKPRMFRHHIPYNLVQKNDRAKTVYTYRHPEDTMVSYYYFLQSLHPEIHFDFNRIFDIFVTGNISYGSYFRNVLSFYEHRADPNLLMVSYERLQKNRKEEILKVAKFLSDEYYTYLVENEENLEGIIQKTSFDYMKKNLYLTRPGSATYRTKPGEKPEEEDLIHFFRKGSVGDGKNTLTKTQRRRIKAAAEDMLQGTSILKEWYGE